MTPNQKRRLTRARNDLAKAERNLAWVLQYEESETLPRHRLRDMRWAAEDRVERLRYRVELREDYP